MSSTSDSEDNVDMKPFLEAADSNFLTDEMFRKHTCTMASKKSKKPIKDTSDFKQDTPKSQRYCEDANTRTCADIDPPEAVQLHISKKLSELIQNQIEFCDVACQQPLRHKLQKSKIKLLPGADCYVKPYEEFEYETKGPSKKPQIKRRKLADEIEPSDREKILKTAISSDIILSAIELRSWAPKPERRGKVFHYTMGSNGRTIHGKLIENEFTKLRRKNKWNESKIRER